MTNTQLASFFAKEYIPKLFYFFLWLALINRKERHFNVTTLIILVEFLKYSIEMTFGNSSCLILHLSQPDVSIQVA